MAKKWISKAIKHPGAMTAVAKHDSGKAGSRARLAITLKKTHKGK